MSKLTLAISKIISKPIERKLRDFRDKYLRFYKIEKLPDEVFDKNINYYGISFCTTCMNRLYHLKEAYLKNIEDNMNYPDVEFVLVNYNSKDELDSWAKENLKKFIDKGLVNYYKTNDPDSWHASKAKNLAHKVASKEIVVNLDGDNYLGENFAFYINYLFNTHGIDSIVQCKKKPFWGAWGRIGLTKKSFIALGGYDEDFHPHGYQDIDLVERAKKMGLKFINIKIDNFYKYLSNSRREKVTNFKNEEKPYSFFNDENKSKSLENINNNVLSANVNGWGNAVLYKNFCNDPITI